jgi:ElaA protein
VSDSPAPMVTPAAGSGLAWTWARFHELGVDNLYDALALRCRVFILEQGPYLDTDGLDRASWHLLGRDADGTLQAYLRVVDPGLKYPEPSIGRVITSPEVRGTGVGHRLTAEGVARCGEAWPGQGIRISAQLRLEAFYVQHGFERVGEPYLEDGIPHLEMFRSASPPVDRPKYPLDEGLQ